MSSLFQTHLIISSFWNNQRFFFFLSLSLSAFYFTPHCIGQSGAAEKKNKRIVLMNCLSPCGNRLSTVDSLKDIFIFGFALYYYVMVVLLLLLLFLLPLRSPLVGCLVTVFFLSSLYL